MPAFGYEEGQFELEPHFVDSRGNISEEGDEVFVRGIGDKFLGIGTFAGQLMLKDSSGSSAPIPVVAVQDTLLSGGQVDLWSTDHTLIDINRGKRTYPIGIYLAELGEFDKKMNAVHEAALGVILD